MGNLPGVFEAKTAKGNIYYRSSITYQRKHISIGSFSSQLDAHDAYLQASMILTDKNSHFSIEEYDKYGPPLSFEKWVMFLNLKDNGMYCKNPIYLKYKHFLYYLDEQTALKFDVDDLFYYRNHKIMRRGGHLFVAEYGMQVNILSRYGIKNYAVAGRDFKFVNGDCNDFRYQNIKIINRYHGVIKEIKNGNTLYVAKIHIKGDTIVGKYLTEAEAAIAYNKAARILKEKGLVKDFPENYVESCTEIEYAKIYNNIRISKNIRNFNL